MKKSLIALAVLGAAGLAQAQSNVTIYGQFDVQIDKKTDSTTAMRAGDNNKLGFKGVEDLGGGLKAIFQAEMRFEPDTGTTEGAPNRPLFQGQSRVGLQGDFGTIRVGRGLSAAQETLAPYEPWGEARNRANILMATVANYNGDPLYDGSSQNRWSNAIWYNSPVVGGFQFNGTLGTKETQGLGTPTTNPYSLSATFNQGPLSFAAAYERNAIGTKFWSLAGSGKVTNDIKLMASYSTQRESLRYFKVPAVAKDGLYPVDLKTRAWLLGANFNVGNGVILAGYGRGHQDGSAAAKQFSIGYEHHLSKRTFLYTDYYNLKSPTGANSTKNINSFDVGINHRF